MRKTCSVLATVLLGIGVLVVGFTCLSWLPTAHAQGPITLDKVLNRSSNVVRVGELLSFTISLENSSLFTLTHVTLVDEYDQEVLRFAWANPAHDLIDPGTGVITWTNVATPPIPLGQSLFFTVYFTAEHPRETVVNAARAQDIVDSNGSVSVTAETSRTQESIGGAAPVFKSLHPPDAMAVQGLPLTFTHVITNDGAAVMTVLPLTDTYDSSFLEFSYAVPTPTTVLTGTLAWSDLTTYFGDLDPFESIVVTTVFTATTQVVGTVNEASTEGALDVYDNDLTAGAAQVPITIIEGSPTATPTSTAQPTSTPAPTQTPTRRANTPVPAQPTATPVPATATATSTPVAVLMPETGYEWNAWGIVTALFGMLVILGGIVLTRAVSSRQA